MKDPLALIILEAGDVRVVGRFYATSMNREFREAVIERRSHDSLGGERWEHCGAIDINDTTDSFTSAMWDAFVALAKTAHLAYRNSLVVKS